MTRKLLLFVLAVLLIPSFASAQKALAQTSLSANINASQSCFVVAAVTGIPTTTANATGGTVTTIGQQSALYIDHELIYVQSVNSTSKQVCGLRGMNGTLASAHANGTMVLAGPPGGFYDFDPAGYCLASTPPTIMSPPQYTPWVNTRTGNQWICSSGTGGSNVWVPGFGNTMASPAVSATVASVAGTTLPSGPLFHVSGTNAITGWTIPTGCNATAAGGCSFSVIPDAVFTWTAAGNIALAGSAVVNKLLTFTWDSKNSKWIPSYIA